MLLLFFTTFFITTLISDKIDLLAVGSVEGLAVDWINQLLYWTDHTYNKVEVARLDGTGRRTLHWYHAFNGTHLRGLVVHPKRG